jgi:hypothetical protein
METVESSAGRSKRGLVVDGMLILRAQRRVSNNS